MVSRSSLSTTLTLLVLGLIPAELPAADASPQLLQPGSGERGLVLETRSGRSGRATKAWVESADGDRTRISLRSGEFLTTIAETRTGFVVAGARETRNTTLELVMVAERSGKVSRMATPGSGGSLLQVRPTLLTRDRELTGAAWLEGDGVRSLGVRAAEWNGVDWGPETVVAAPGRRGSQTGLTGVTLADGSALLVWAAFDGRDDEITWSHRRGGAWSTPRRLTANRAPDVTPTLMREGDGVVMAWSQMHGTDYRVMTATFESDGGWTKPRPVSGPRGYFPEFVELDSRAFLVWRSGEAQAWAVSEIGKKGRLSRQTLVHEASEKRPALVLGDRDELRLRWSGPDRETTARWEVRP